MSTVGAASSEWVFVVVVDLDLPFPLVVVVVFDDEEDEEKIDGKEDWLLADLEPNW